MDDQNAIALTEAITKQNELQGEANELMRSLILALQATAQELLELRRQLAEAEEV